MRRFIILSVLACAGSAASTQAEIFNIDFGDPGQQSAYLGWNNIVSNASGGSSLNRLVEGSGPLSTVSLTMTDPFYPGSNQNGTTTASSAIAFIFPPQATGDSFFGSVVSVGGVTEPTGGYTLAGLDPTGATTYTFNFFTSYIGATDNRETAYKLDGANSRTAYLNPSNNTSEMGTATGVVPDASGHITLTVSPGPNNNNPSGFYYLGALQIVSVVPEPASISALALAGAFLRRRLPRDGPAREWLS